MPSPLITRPTVTERAWLAAVGARLRQRRESLGWSLRDAAGRAGISHVMVSFIERGRSTKVPLLLLVRLSAALGLELSDLLQNHPYGGDASPTRQRAEKK